MGEFFPERVELELCNVIRCSPQFICICKDKYDNLYLCSSYYLDSLNMFGIAVIVSKQQLNDYINGINDDLISIFIKNSEENKYNKYDVWVSADVKYMITFTKTFAIASYMKNYFDYINSYIVCNDFEDSYIIIKSIVEAYHNTNRLNYNDYLINYFPKIAMFLRITYRKGSNDLKNEINKWLINVASKNYYDNLYLEDAIIGIKG